MMTIVVNAEEKYGTEIPDDKVRGLRTGDAVDFYYCCQRHNCPDKLLQ